MGFCSRALAERADNTMIKSLDAILLLLTDLGLRFYDLPEFEHVFTFSMLTAVGVKSPVAISSTYASSLRTPSHTASK